MKWVTKALLAGGATMGSVALANAVLASHAGRPEQISDGDQGVYLWKHGAVRYRTAGEGDSVLLVHSVGAGASAYEWRKNFGPLSEKFSCYAPDLLGFGLSDKPSITYTSAHYVELLRDFIMNAVGEPVTVVASGHSAAYALLMAQKHSQIVRSLLLICPSGMIGISPALGGGASAIGSILSIPVFGQSAYYGLTSRRNVEKMLRTIYFDQSNITPDLVDAYWRTSHQPGAIAVMSSFLSGLLDADVSAALEKLEVPTMLVWGREAKLTPLDVAGQLLQTKPELELRIMERVGNLPHDERPDEFNDIAINFISRPSEEERIHREVEELQKEAEQPSGV
jgi:pimeloyl-ACP methyl ester carboxylesterase